MSIDFNQQIIEEFRANGGRVGGHFEGARMLLLTTSGPSNAPSWGAALKLIHDAFRRELALIRKEITESGRPGLGAQLRVNCLTVCQGLQYHHTGEDAGVFPALAERYPELASTLDRLHQEHQKIAALLDDLQEIIALDGANPLLVLSEVERLSDELESHLTYEEEQLIPILDASTL